MREIKKRTKRSGLSSGTSFKKHPGVSECGACMPWQASVAKARETLEELQESFETLQGIQTRSSLDSAFHGFNGQQERLE